MRLVGMAEDVRKQFNLNSLLRYLEMDQELQHAVCGLAEEAGEVSGLLKRQVFQCKNVPIDRWADELGDVLWYWLAVCNALCLDPEEVFMQNRNRLEAIYGPFGPYVG